MDLRDIHDLVKDLIGAGLIWAVGRQGHRVGKFLKDLNCYFDRTRALEKENRKLKRVIAKLAAKAGVEVDLKEEEEE